MSYIWNYIYHSSNFGSIKPLASIGFWRFIGLVSPFREIKKVVLYLQIFNTKFYSFQNLSLDILIQKMCIIDHVLFAQFKVTRRLDDDTKIRKF